MLATLSMKQTPHRLSRPTSFSLAVSVTNSNHSCGEIHSPRSSSRSSHLKQAEIGIFEPLQLVRLHFVPGFDNVLHVFFFDDRLLKTNYHTSITEASQTDKNFTQRSHPAHMARRVNRHSHSTSCEGTSPSEPRAPGNSNMVDATARAAAHAKMEPHRRRHPCSARCRINWVSVGGLAQAIWVTKALVSREQRTSSQKNLVRSGQSPTSSPLRPPC